MCVCVFVCDFCDFFFVISVAFLNQGQDSVTGVFKVRVSVSVCLQIFLCVCACTHPSLSV